MVFASIRAGFSSEGDTTGGERAAVPSAEEAPFSAEQLAWIDRLIAARHSAPPRPMDLPLVPVPSTADGPSSRLPLVFVPM